VEISYFQQPELSDSGLAARAGGKIGFYVGFPIQFVLCNIITTITNWDTEIVHYLLLDLARTPIRSRFLCGSESHLGVSDSSLSSRLVGTVVGPVTRIRARRNYSPDEMGVLVLYYSAAGRHG